MSVGLKMPTSSWTLADTIQWLAAETVNERVVPAALRVSVIGNESAAAPCTVYVSWNEALVDAERLPRPA